MKVILLTVGFPYGDGEQFLETELPILAERCDEVHIVPYAFGVKDMVPRSVPKNVRLRTDLNELIYKRLYQLRDMPTLSLFADHPSDAIAFVRELLTIRPLSYTDIKKKYVFARAIEETLHEEGLFEGGAIGYSYWMTHTAFALARLKSRYPDSKMVSRSHGFDVFPDRQNKNRLPWYGDTLQGLDGVYPCSKTTASYTSDMYRGYKSKISHAYLGVKNQRMNRGSNDGVLRIVTCSSLKELKRVDAIAQAIKNVHRSIEWTHFGDGPERPTIESICSSFPSHVSMRLRGHVSHADVIGFYKNNPVDVFINFSETEALPVSLMEAMSFGIPCIAPDLGGIAELVDDSCGWLIDADCSIDELAKLIDAINPSNKSKRNAAIQKQRKLFNAGKNYGAFVIKNFS